MGWMSMQMAMIGTEHQDIEWKIKTFGRSPNNIHNLAPFLM